MSSAWERIRLRIETKEDMTEAARGQVQDETRTISSHILDTSRGKAASNVDVTVYRLEPSSSNNDQHWQQLDRTTPAMRTNGDGRVTQLVNALDFTSGIYKLHFNVRPYFEALGVSSFYPFIEIVVECVAGQHYHIPLLLNPYGYSTYRGT